MASTYLLLSSILLAATQAQGQCPLSNCSLVSQVNICTQSATMSGGCTDSQCVMALRENSTVDECCNKIEQSIINAPTSGQNGGICGEAGAQAQFGDTLNFVNSASLHNEINEGTYIMPQMDPEFIYSCNGCIKSIQLAVSPNSLLKDAQLQERIKFHTFTDKTGDRSIYQRREDVAMWNSSVVNIILDRKVVDYRPIGSTEVCFSQGDVFGFTIEAGSDITVLTRVPPDTRLVLNASSTLETISGCPQLRDSGLYTTIGSFSSVPLIHIVTAAGGFPPTEPPLTTTEPSITETTTQATIATRATPESATTPSNLNSTPSMGSVSPPGSGSIIYAAVGFGGAVGILLIIVIIVVVICIVQRRKCRSYEYGNGFKFGSPIPGADSKSDGVAVMAFSHRMSQLQSIDSSPERDIITIENTLAEPSESPMHHYDLPSELISADNIHRMPWTDVARQKNNINMQTAASSVSGGSISQFSKTYDSASELGTSSHRPSFSDLLHSLKNIQLNVRNSPQHKEEDSGYDQLLQLGAPLELGKNLYPDLQNLYIEQ